MRLLVRTLPVVLALGCTHNTPRPAQPALRAEYYSSASLARTADSLKSANSIAKVLGDRGKFLYLLVTRSATAGPEQHADWTDVVVVQAGSATVLLGGRYEGSHEESPGELRGGTIVGASEQRIAVGDLLVIPAGIPHQVLLGPGESVRYVAVKAPAH